MLWNFTESKLVNLPYFLLKSLERMATKVQIQKDNRASILFHFSLIKILVENVVERKKMLCFDFLASINLLPQTGSSSIKVDKEDPKQENPKKESTHTIMEMKPINKEGSKPGKKLTSKFSKKTTLQSIDDDKVDKGTREYVTLTHQAKLKAKIEDTIQDEFLMRPRTRCRVKRNPRRGKPSSNIGNL